MLSLMQSVGLSMAMILAPVVLLLMFMAVGSNLVQHRLVFSTARLKFDFAKLNPMTGLKRMFGFDGMINLVKGLIKLLIVGTVTWMVLWPERGRLDGLLGQRPLALASIMIASADEGADRGALRARRDRGRRLSAATLPLHQAQPHEQAGDQGRIPPVRRRSRRQSQDPPDPHGARQAPHDGRRCRKPRSSS